MSKRQFNPFRGKQNPAFFVITANDLLTGDVVYFSTSAHWSPHLADAKPYVQSEEAQSQADHLTTLTAHEAVGLYVIPLADKLTPLSFKEQLRAKGPTNYHHGKQQIA